MKATNIIFGLCLAFNMSLAQELTDLTPPSNPALTILGMQPLDVTKPKSIDQFEATIVNSFVQSNEFIIPNDFALEVMPFWLKSNPSLAYNRTKLEKVQCEPLKNLAISLASINDSSTTIASNSKIAFGIRTQLISGRLSKASLDTIDNSRKDYQLNTKSESNADILVFRLGAIKSKMKKEDLLDTARIIIKKLWPTDGASVSDADNWITELTKDEGDSISVTSKAAIFSKFKEKAKKNDQETLEKHERKTNDELAALVEQNLLKRYGWFLEVAGSFFLDFPTGDASFSKIPKFGTWAFITYKTEKQMWDFTGMARYITDYGIEQGSSNYDLGTAIYFNQEKFIISAEALYRTQTTTIEQTTTEDGFTITKQKTRNDARFSLGAVYKISEQVNLTYNLTKSFKYDLLTPNLMVSQLSLNLGLGKVPLQL